MGVGVQGIERHPSPDGKVEAHIELPAIVSPIRKRRLPESIVVEPQVVIEQIMPATQPGGSPPERDGAGPVISRFIKGTGREPGFLIHSPGGGFQYVLAAVDKLHGAACTDKIPNVNATPEVSRNVAYAEQVDPLPGPEIYVVSAEEVIVGFRGVERLVQTGILRFKDPVADG